MEIKTKINKWDLIKPKSFSTTKETISKGKIKPSEWEKIIANETTDKGFTSKYTSSSIPENNPIKKWVEDPNRHFSKENTQTANKHMKSCLTSLIIREMQIKTTLFSYYLFSTLMPLLYYHLIPVTMATIKKSINNKC